MGYYSNFDFVLEKAKFKNPKEFIDEIKNSDIYQTWKEADFVFINYNELVDISLEEYYDKFYDSDEVAEIISKHLKEGKVKLFFEGEDGEKWSFTIFPNYVLDKQIEEIGEFDIERIIEDEDISDETKKNVLKHIEEYISAEKRRIDSLEKAVRTTPL